METVVRSTSSEIVLAHLAPGDDLDVALHRLARDEDVVCGVVLSVTGALSNVRLNVARQGQGEADAPGIVEVEGFAEVSGQGVIGRVRDAWTSAAVSGIERRTGDPYVHVHLTATTSQGTFCGHLLPGCTVRGIEGVSHFTVSLAVLEGVKLDYRVSDRTTRQYPNGIPYYDLGPT